MDSFVYITLGIISSWLIWMSYMLYKTLTIDKNFVFIIFNKKQLISYWLFIAIIIAISFYLFFIRMQNTGRVINVYALWAYILEIIDSLSWSTLIILAMVVILWVIFVFLGMRLLYKHINLRLLALYLYYYQYIFFRRKLVGGQVYFLRDCSLYLINRVMFFTENKTVALIAHIIWPRSFYWFEPRICKIIIPYLMVFDVITQDGNISKVFQVIPWYYLYMLIRTGWVTFHGFFKPANTEFSKAVYKKFLVNGKIHRMAIVPNPKDFNA